MELTCPICDESVEIEPGDLHCTPGVPATGPTYSCGGEPSIPPEIEFPACPLCGADLDCDDNYTVAADDLGDVDEAAHEDGLERRAELREDR